MAARFRKVGVTTLGACAGLGLAGWALNPFDRQYAVSFVALNLNSIRIAFKSVEFDSLHREIRFWIFHCSSDFSLFRIKTQRNHFEINSILVLKSKNQKNQNLKKILFDLSLAECKCGRYSNAACQA